MKRLVTCESVRAGHPDKLCDYISDSILDACLEVDPYARVAVETLATKGLIVVAGEVTCKNNVNYKRVIKQALKDRNYNPFKFWIKVCIHTQSPDIAHGVDESLEDRVINAVSTHDIGAGDQGTVYGYATDETKLYIPLPLYYSHCICNELDRIYHHNKEHKDNQLIHGLGVDGKCQVTVEYDNKKQKTKSIIISTQHDESTNKVKFIREIFDCIIKPLFGESYEGASCEVLINPSGKFVIGGPEGDTGLTGRKLMVDTYGGVGAHGGGAFSGKDPTKVDRSGAYMARFIAKHIVAGGYAKECTIAISYAIGKAQPTAIQINCHGTEKYDIETRKKATLETFDLRPAAIIDCLDLRKPIYKKTSAYGHFSQPDFPWEQLSYASKFTKNINRLLA